MLLVIAALTVSDMFMILLVGAFEQLLSQATTAAKQTPLAALALTAEATLTFAFEFSLLRRTTSLLSATAGVW